MGQHRITYGKSYEPSSGNEDRYRNWTRFHGTRTRLCSEFIRQNYRKPSYWSQLGSSKNRSNEQQEEGKAIIQDMVNEVSASVLVCFTDGSCLPNPGPCGAGAVIYHPDGQEECIKRPVAAYGSILLGELVAILSVTEHLVTKDSQIQHREIRIFSDSQTAVGIITLNWVSNHYLDVIKKSMKTYLH